MIMRDGQHYVAVTLLLCLSADVFGQTFQYSRGWTNGKKRANIPLVLQEPTDGSEVLGVCQMLRLREMMAQKRRDQSTLPCEVIGKSEEEIMDRFRRKTGDFEPVTFDAPREQ